MVLQRDLAVPVWGTAASGEEVVVKIAGEAAKAKADEKGHWSLKLGAMKTGGPHEMTMSGKATIIFKNVLIGVVWICSDQSNIAIQDTHEITCQQVVVHNGPRPTSPIRQKSLFCVAITGFAPA